MRQFVMISLALGRLVLSWVFELTCDTLLGIFMSVTWSISYWRLSVGALVVAELAVTYLWVSGDLTAQWLLVPPLMWPAVPFLYALIFVVLLGAAAELMYEY